MSCNDKNYKNFVRYEVPKQGIFLVPDEQKEYCIINGWPTKKVVLTIIGEDNHSYVTELIQGEIGYWQGDNVEYQKTYTTKGLHKTRLIRWLPTQLNLF